LIAIRDLVGRIDRVEIPVYLCDSIMTPSEYGGLFAGGLGKARQLKTAPTTVLIPTEIATNREAEAKYAEQLEFCVRNSYSPDEFIQRCRDEGLPINEHQLHIELYNELVTLDKANKNGVWARIIKNAFAPLFIGQVDYVAGNPPWINLDALPRAYREQFISINQGVYGLFPHKGLRARHGSAETDISTLFLYVSLDKYVKEHGRLGFVITQSVFLSDAGKGFRKFSLPDGKPIAVRRVDDLSSIKVFEGAANRTAVVIAERDSATIYPVEYIRWALVQDPELHSPIPDILDLDEFLPSCQLLHSQARPISKDLTSPWIIGQADEIRSLGRAIGPSSYKAHVGIHTGGANAVYWIEILGVPRPGTVLVRNVTAGAKKIVPTCTASVEEGFVYPYLRGRDVHRWISEPSLYILAPQDPGRPHLGLKENELRRGYPKTYEYFANFKQFLEDRVHFKKYLEPAGAVFYSLYDVKAYTYAPYKVVWRYIASEMTCAVISTVQDSSLGEKLVLPDNKLIIVSLDNAAEAHYLCALLNSCISRFIVSRYVVGTQIAPHVLENIAIPRYVAADSLHGALAEASLTCHRETTRGNAQEVRTIEGEIDRLAAGLWGIPIGDLGRFGKAH
ncbi:MAG: SAM-dependent DNA methyltransferase, partial [bacterium]